MEMDYIRPVKDNYSQQSKRAAKSFKGQET